MAETDGLRDETMANGTGVGAPGSVSVVSIVRHKYDGVLCLPGKVYPMAAHRVAANENARLVHALGRYSPDWWGAPGRVLTPFESEPAPPLVDHPHAGSLRIAMGVMYDPGSQVMRFHSAINQYTKHASLMVRWGDTNPYCSLRQYDGDRDSHLVMDAIHEADVLHCHVNYALVDNGGVRNREDQLLIRHYHGSRPNGGTRMQAETDILRGALILCARLTFQKDVERIKGMRGRDIAWQWLPITIPVLEYAALRRQFFQRSPDGVFRIAHSPTRRNLKGTSALLEVVSKLQSRGVPVRVSMIENMKLGDAILAKATHADAVFDSFWLGLQTSGLEGGAMGIPCIAGDRDTRVLYEKEIGYVPYTFADGPKELEAIIEQMVIDSEFRAKEAHRLRQYVRDYHDYPAVARRYEDILMKQLGREDVRTDIPSVVESLPVQTNHEEPVERQPVQKPKTKKPKKTEKR